MEGGKKINRGRGLELEVLGQNVSTTADLWRAKPSEPWCGRDVMARVGPIPALSFEDAKGVAATRSFGPGASAGRIMACAEMGKVVRERRRKHVLRSSALASRVFDAHSTHPADHARGPRSSALRCGPGGSGGWHETRR